jgi:hypothetical protein
MRNRKTDRRAAALFAVASAVAVAGVGCGKQVPEGEAPGGTTLCINYYARCVDPIFHQSLPASNVSCSGQGLGCHYRAEGAAGGAFKVLPAPPDDLEMTRNFISAKNQATAGVGSKLLTKPLADSVAHNGGDLFPDTSDANYQRILYWIQSSVDDEGDINSANDTPQCQAVYAANPC